jgi:hypothetical protein
MKNTSTLCVSLGLLLILAAVAAAGASATLWLANGASLVTKISASGHGKDIFHHEGGIFGSIEIECSGLATGTEGPGAEGSSTSVSGLAGGEEDLVKCVSLKGMCVSPVAHILHLPWKLLLLLEGTATVSDVLSGGGGEPEGELLCSIGNLTCGATGKATFIGNGTNGAKFEATRAGTEKTCNDGGKGWVTGTSEKLGFTIS